MASTTSAHGDLHRVRLVSWVTGEPLAETDRNEAALESLGRMRGRFDAALKGFMHPGALRDLEWDIHTADRSAHRLSHVTDVEDRALLVRFLKALRHGCATPRQASRRCQSQ